MSSQNTNPLKEFARLVPRLTKSETDDLLLYLKTILAIRRAYRGKSKPPSPEQWERLPYWAKWMIFCKAIWWSTLADIHGKFSRAKIT